MSVLLSRRKVLAAPLALAGCAGASPYFCKSAPPSSQRLVHANGGEPSTLDPALLLAGNGDHVVAALMDSLTSFHPITHQQAAGLATHLPPNLLDIRLFKYASIDTNWRPR